MTPNSAASDDVPGLPQLAGLGRRRRPDRVREQVPAAEAVGLGAVGDFDVDRDAVLEVRRPGGRGPRRRVRDDADEGPALVPELKDLTSTLRTRMENNE